MIFPAGTRFISVVVNKSKVASSLSNFLYQIDLSSILSTDAAFKACISTVSNITVYDPVSDTIRPKYAKLDLTSNILLIYFDGNCSTSVDKLYFVCAGLSLDYVNSKSALTANYYSNYYGLNELVNGSFTEDIAGSLNGSVVSPAAIGVTGGKFGNVAGSMGTTGYINLGDITALNAASTFSIEGVAKRQNNSNPYRLFFSYKDANNFISIATGGVGNNYLNININSGGSSYGMFLMTGLIANSQYFHYNAVFDSAGSGNAGKLKIYINGQPVTLTFVGTIGSCPNLAGVVKSIGASSYSWNADVDEIGIRTIASTSGNVLSRYNMIFSPATFFTIGASTGVLFSHKNRSIVISDTIQDIDTWDVYLDINGAGYNKIDTYTAPYIVGGDEGDVRNYAFSYEYTSTPLLSIGDVVRFKFVPAGYDVGSSAEEFESSAYNIIEALEEVFYKNNSFIFSDFVLSL